MKIQIQTFKESGKWYDTFDDELPSRIKAFDNDLIIAYLRDKHKRCIDMAFVYTIEGVPRLVLPMKLN